MALREEIRRLREDFKQGTLDESSVPAAPGDLFSRWLGHASECEVPEFQAMCLSTVSAEGLPSSRIVYLRDFDKDTYTFYTNYNSKKGHDIAVNPHAALNFFWPQLERQVRMEGVIEKGTTQQSDEYFNQRPFSSRVGAWASQQSQPLSSRSVLEHKTEEIAAKHTDGVLARPPHWGAYVFRCSYYEFWQGRPSRLHDRIAFKKESKGWTTTRLYP